MNLADIKAVVFDVFGSVVDWRSGVARDVAPFLQRHGRMDIEPSAFADAWRQRYQPSMDVVRRGERPFVRLDELHRESLNATLREIGMDPTNIDDAELEDLNRTWHRLDPWPDALDGLSRLRTRYIIAPLSNGNVSMMVNMAKRGGLPWDAILGAELVQAYKPMPAVYLRTADILGMEPGQICMAAAHNSDLAAARACGLRTAFFVRRTEHGPGQTSDLRPEQDWDVVALDIRDLAVRLEQHQLLT